jgi:hypothetical protein
MNGNLPGHSRDDEGLDPELSQLFDAAKTTAGSGNSVARSGDAFVAAVLLSMQRTRRLRLVRQIAGLALILTLSAFLAPYVAQQTLLVASSPVGIGCVCAVLLAWRIARRARAY